jgi:protoporphyrinogen oxidase
MAGTVDNCRVAVIAGAGPAGLTAALELLRRTDVIPLVFESASQVGGISKTVNYRGNRMDLGGHRFFSKSDWVMNWWQQILPVADADQGPQHLAYQGRTRSFSPSHRADVAEDAVMLVRQRLSRIFYRRRFFDYPLKLNAATLKNLGFAEALQIGLSYGQSRLSARHPEVNLEDFLINRFGVRLYRTFFKDYTEKVWGVPCQEISAEWGAQRIKGLSITKALSHALSTPFRARDAAQKQTETSLIERFLYPTLGPGQMWEEVARRVSSAEGSVHLEHRIIGIERNGRKIEAVTVLDMRDGSCRRVACDYFISTMPVSELCGLLGPETSEIGHIAANLPYRDFMTAGLLMSKMTGRHALQSAGRSGHTNSRAPLGMPPDNWIYIQEPDVKIGRLQIFNNWSPAMVADPNTIWLGLEYFCRENDELWSMDKDSFVDFAAHELEKIGLIDKADVLDGTLVRVPKAYPAYFGEYGKFNRVRDYLDEFGNLYAIGRNGMHRYNNQDHSMLAADAAVTAISNGGSGKKDIWQINAEETYHEEADKVA